MKFPAWDEKKVKSKAVVISQATKDGQVGRRRSATFKVPGLGFRVKEAFGVRAALLICQQVSHNMFEFTH